MLHSATKWISGHGTSIGGVIVDAGKFNWGAYPERFPKLHYERANTQTINYWKACGFDALGVCLKVEMLRDLGCCLSSTAAQQFIIGLETLSLRCERQANNALHLARWLQAHPQTSYVCYLGLEDHASYKLGRKYMNNGLASSVLTFGVKGGQKASYKFMDSLKLIIQTAK